MIIKKAVSSGNSSVQWVKHCWNKILICQCCCQRHLIHSERDLCMRKSSQGVAGGGVYAWAKTVDGGLIFLPLLSQVSAVILDSRVEIHLNSGKQVFVCRHVDLELCEANENAALIIRKWLIVLNSLDTSHL